MKNEFDMNLPGKYLFGLLARLFLVAVFLLFHLSASAQQRTISGVVTGTDNAPFPGVSVMIKGTTVGTLTGADGKYTLSVPESAKILVFSFVGMKTEEVGLGSSDVYNVKLSESLVGLDEVIVIGYGTAKKSDLTGSVSRVEGEDIQIQAPTQVVESLSGTVAGLYSVQSSSAQGGGSMEIRGPTSLTAGTEPMIVLDGVIYNGSLKDINPADIQSMDILRDASSAAVYGSKAASGVILITTTRGKLGKPTINFSSKIGIANTTNDLKPFGPEEYLDFHRDYFTEINTQLPYGYFFHPNELPDGVTLEQWRNMSANPAADNTDEWISRIGLWPIEIENYKAGRTTDFYDLCVVPGLRQDYNLSAGGATDQVQYYWSIGYLDNEGIIKGDEFSTIRTRLNLELKVTDWISVGANTQFAYRDESVVQADLGAMSNMSPYGSMWNEDGTIRRLPGDYTLNPLENYYGQDRLYKISTLFSSLFAQIQLPFGIQYKLSFQPSFSDSKDFNYWSTKTSTGSESYVGGYGRRDESTSFAWMIDNLITWKQTFGMHLFDITLLANAERSKSWWARMENSNFAPNENLIYNALQFGSKPGVSNSDAQSSGDALMARLNYTLNNRYLFTASVRRDGYSAFGQENPRATFPAFAFAWKIDEESFYNISWLNRLKLRLSWGVNGNRDIGIYSALARMGSILGYNGSKVLSGVYNTTLANPGLRWERTQSTNIGFDIGLLEDRVDMSIDAYQTKTVDLLMNRQLPQITGFSSITSNLGELGNRGLELSVNTINIKGDNFDWRSNLVFSMNKNEIIKLWGNYGDFTLLGIDQNGELPDFTNKWFPGEARDIVWDYDVTGVWQLGEEEAAAVYGMVPGDYKAVDVNQDGDYTQLYDKKFIGYKDPRYRIGFKNEVTFLKNFTASLFLRADLGHIRAMGFLTQNKSTHGRRNTWELPYWSRENPTNDFQRHDFPDNVDQFGGNLIIYKPTGFLRVQDVSLTYSLPHTIAQRLKLQNLRVFGTIRNLFTFTKWPGFDPESNMTPMPKVFTIGLDLSI
jgi:TonB-linked SusC/RagA family outer membrane protein